jgi:hypothetical protein
MPHSLLLQTSNQQYFALLPNIKVHLGPRGHVVFMKKIWMGMDCSEMNS